METDSEIIKETELLQNERNNSKEIVENANKHYAYILKHSIGDEIKHKLNGEYKIIVKRDKMSFLEIIKKYTIGLFKRTKKEELF